MASASHGMGAGVPVEVGGERVVLSAELSTTWHRFRQCTCAVQPLWCGPLGVPFIPVFALCYALCCGWARRREASSWQLLLTPSTLYYKQMLYDWWCCGYRTESVAIPLHRITGIRLSRGCCDERGECPCINCSCGFEDASTSPWKMLVFTSKMASSDNPMPELVLHCVRDPVEVKRRVLEARASFLHRAESRRPAAPKMSATSRGVATAPSPVKRSNGASSEDLLLRPDPSQFASLPRSVSAVQADSLP